jgi:hypothetical protein
MTGEHYVVDVLAAVPLVGVSVTLYWYLGKPLLTTDE